MTKNLPLYEITIDESQESFVDCISLVDKPAIESNFLAFSEHKELQFSFNDERKELLGIAMIPDMKIFRKDDAGNGYEVFFSKDTIRQIAQVFFKRGFQKNMNINHTEVPADSYVFQSFIVDSEQGINSPKSLNAPDGSWIVGVKVQDNSVWDDIKLGRVKGFSAEGLFLLAESKIKQEHKTEETELLEFLRTINSILIK